MAEAKSKLKVPGSINPKTIIGWVVVGGMVLGLTWAFRQNRGTSKLLEGQTPTMADFKSKSA